MPTNRRRRVRELIDRDVPTWVVRLLNENVAPREGEDGCDQWFGWMFCDERVPGLPQSDTPEGNAIWLRASDAMKSRATERRLAQGGAVASAGARRPPRCAPAR